MIEREEKRQTDVTKIEGSTDVVGAKRGPEDENDVGLHEEAEKDATKEGLFDGKIAKIKESDDVQQGGKKPTKSTSPEHEFDVFVWIWALI